MKTLLLIASTILAVACSGKDESTTETKAVEEKVVELKEEAKTEEPLAETKPKTVGVNNDELERLEDLFYRKGSKTPYTGKSFEFHENGQKKWELNFKDGKEEGLAVRWHENGQKMLKLNIKNRELVSGQYWNIKGEPVDSMEEAGLRRPTPAP